MLMLFMAHTVIAWRPLVIDDADPVEPQQFELDAGVGYEYESGNKFWEYPFGLTYGLMPSVDVAVGFGYLYDEENETESIGDLTLCAKWQFIKSCPFGARHALVSSIKLPTADEHKDLGSGETDYDLMWILSRAFGSRLDAQFNLGYSWIGGTGDDILHYGAAVYFQVLNKLQWVGEIFTEKELDNHTDTAVRYNTGLRWNPIESLTLDVAAGSKISGDAPDFFGTAGLTWTFGFNDV